MSKKVIFPKMINETNTLIEHFDLQWQSADFEPLQEWLQMPTAKIDDFFRSNFTKIRKKPF